MHLYFIWIERKADPSDGKIVLGAKIKQTSGVNLVGPVQRVKRNYNVVM